MPETNFNPLLQWSDALIEPEVLRQDDRSGRDRRVAPGGLRARASAPPRRRRSDIWTGDPQAPLSWDNLL
jgi:hypothetical protein